MTAIFFAWPKEQDAVFKTAYLERTGEHIEGALSDGLRYAVGSTRATASDIAALTAKGFFIDALDDLGGFGDGPDN